MQFKLRRFSAKGLNCYPFFPVAIALFDIRKKNRNPASEIGRVAALAIVLIFLMVIDWNGFSFYKYISLIPGAKAIRVVTRIIMVLSFFFAVSVGVLFTRLDDWRDKGVSAVLLSVFSFLLLCAVATDQYVHPRFVSRYSKSVIQARAKEVADEVMKKNPSAKFFAYMPPKDKHSTYAVHTYAMLASQNIHIPTVNGYSGSIPRNYDFYLNYDNMINRGHCSSGSHLLQQNMTLITSHLGNYLTVSLL